MTDDRIAEIRKVVASFPAFCRAPKDDMLADLLRALDAAVKERDEVLARIERLRWALNTAEADAERLAEALRQIAGSREAHLKNLDGDCISAMVRRRFGAGDYREVVGCPACFASAALAVHATRKQET